MGRALLKRVHRVSRPGVYRAVAGADRRESRSLPRTMTKAFRPSFGGRACSLRRPSAERCCQLSSPPDRRGHRPGAAENGMEWMVAGAHLVVAGFLMVVAGLEWRAAFPRRRKSA